jgi:hypothetical protein
MADLKITELTAYTPAISTDIIPIVDITTTTTKKITINSLFTSIPDSLISDTDSTDDLGSSSKYWANGYFDKIYLNATATLDGATGGVVNITGIPNLTNSQTIQFNTATFIKMTTDGNRNIGLGAGSLGNGGALSCSYDMAIGGFSLAAVTSGSNNVAIGDQAGYRIKTGHNNMAIGSYALNYDVGGNENVGIGGYSAHHITGADNIGIGYQALFTGAAVNYNVAIGAYAGYSNTSSSGIFIGYQAGYHETGASKLFIDNIGRSSEADGRVKALIYGVFAAATADQNVTMNAVVNTSENYQVDGVQVVSNRVIDAKADDTINAVVWDATTAGVLTALRDAMITHGLIAAA